MPEVGKFKELRFCLFFYGLLFVFLKYIDYKINALSLIRHFGNLNCPIIE